MLHKQAAYRHLIYNRFILLSNQSYNILFFSLFIICSGFEFIANKLIWYQQNKTQTQIIQTKSFIVWIIDTSLLKLVSISILTLLFDKMVNTHGYHESLKQVLIERLFGLLISYFGWSLIILFVIWEFDFIFLGLILLFVFSCNVTVINVMIQQTLIFKTLQTANTITVGKRVSIKMGGFLCVFIPWIICYQDSLKILLFALS